MVRENSIVKSFFCLLVIFCTIKLNGQVFSNNCLYINTSTGLSRSEDGLKFMTKTSASQWTAMINLGLGYRLNKFVGFEFNGAAMLTELKAEGNLTSNNETAKVRASHKNLVLGPIMQLPVGTNFEVFFRPSIGLLFSSSTINSQSTRNFNKSTTNFGYLITLGCLTKLSNQIALSLQFDFSDSYGSDDVWHGDIGFLNIGMKYILKQKSNNKN